MPSPCTVTAQLQTADDQALQGNAFVRFRLRNFAGFVPRVLGTSVVAETQVDELPDGSGHISATLWGNDNIDPSGTFYTVEFWNGGRITSQANYLITGASFDLDSAGQMNPPTPTPATSVTQILLQTNGVNNGSQSKLNLASSDGSVVLTDNGSGTINLAASASFLSTPLFWSRVYATDSSLSVGGLVNDGPLLQGVNLTNQLSGTAYQGPGADIAQVIASTSNGVNGSWYNISNADQTAGQAVGVRFRNVPIFTSRWVPIPTFAQPANTDMVYFIGLSADVGSGGTKPGVSTVTCTPTWFQNIAVCGFYYRPSESANWQLLTSDGAGNSTKTILTNAVSNSLTTELSFTFDGTTVTFYIAGAKVGTISTTLIPANTGVALNAAMGNAGSNATALVEKFGFAYMAMGIR